MTQEEEDIACLEAQVAELCAENRELFEYKESHGRLERDVERLEKELEDVRKEALRLSAAINDLVAQEIP